MLERLLSMKQMRSVLSKNILRQKNFEREKQPKSFCFSARAAPDPGAAEPPGGVAVAATSGLQSAERTREAHERGGRTLPDVHNLRGRDSAVRVSSMRLRAKIGGRTRSLSHVRHESGCRNTEGCWRFHRREINSYISSEPWSD